MAINKKIGILGKRKPHLDDGEATLRIWDGMASVQVADGEEDFKGDYPKEIITISDFYNKYENLKENDFVEIAYDDGKWQQSSANNETIATSIIECTKKGYPALEISDDVSNLFVGEDIVELSVLGSVFGFDVQEFYLYNFASFIFGPFRQENGKVFSLDGASFNFYDDVLLITVLDGFLLNQPRLKIRERDCMSQSQILDWFQKKPDFSISFGLQQIKDQVVDSNFEGIELERINKALFYINKFNFQTAGEITVPLCVDRDFIIRVNTENIRKIDFDELDNLAPQLRKKIEDTTHNSQLALKTNLASQKQPSEILTYEIQDFSKNIKKEFDSVDDFIAKISSGWATRYFSQTRHQATLPTPFPLGTK